jgi:outer membrane protein, multidrug efflux system
MNKQSSIQPICMLLVLALALQACATNSTRHGPPAMGLPEAFRTQPQAVPPDRGETGVDSGRPGLEGVAGWPALGDPLLKGLLERANAGNLDVAAARARIEAARAVVGVARSASLPELTAGASVSREGISEKGLFGQAPGNAFPATYTLSRIGLDASWELDLFGTQRATRRAAEAGQRDAAAQLDGVRLSLAAEIARVYVEHAVVAGQLKSAREVVAVREQELALLEQRRAEGEASDAQVTQARISLEQARSDLPLLAAEADVRRHAMGVLLGTGEYVELPANSPVLGGQLEPVMVELRVQPGLPADLLRRRPDIREAEARWAAAGATRDAAFADQFPHIALTSSVGLESLDRGSLFESASRYWSVIPQVSIPIFDGGRRRSLVKQRDAELQAATAEYRKAVIGALFDVERALLRHRGAVEELDANVRAMQQADALLKLERARHEEGETSLAQLLEARRRFEEQRQRLLQAKQLALLSLVSLHKSLGGDILAAGAST